MSMSKSNSLSKVLKSKSDLLVNVWLEQILALTQKLPISCKNKDIYTGW